MNKFEKLLLQQEKDVLVKLLSEYSIKYPEIQNEISAELGQLDENKEIVDLKKEIRTIIKKNKSYNFINWRGCDNIMTFYDELIEKCKQRANQGYYAVSYTILLDIIEQSIKLANIADSSSGSLTWTVDSAIRAVTAVAETINDLGTEQQKKEAFNSIIRMSKKKVLDGWRTDRYQVLATALPLITKNNSKKFLKTSSDFLNNCNDEFTFSLCAREDILLQVQVFLKLDKRGKAIEVLDINLSHDDIRKVRVALALEDSEYDKAEKLVLEKLNSIKERDLYWIKEWHELLDVVYEISNQHNKRIGNLTILVEKGDIQKYDLLKCLLIEDGFWELEYSELLSKLEKSLPTHYFADILNREQEWEKLYDLVYNNMEMIKEYGEQLYQDYPLEVTNLIRQYVLKEMASVYDRKGYRKIGKLVINYSKYGSKFSALKLIEELKGLSINKKRTAFQDEMKKAEEKINKL